MYLFILFNETPTITRKFSAAENSITKHLPIPAQYFTETVKMQSQGGVPNTPIPFHFQMKRFS